VVVLLIAAAALAFVAAPLFRTHPAGEPDWQACALSRARELQSQRDMLLGSLKDLEDDRATDKIGDEDYRDLKARLSGQAIEVLKRLDELEQEREQASDVVRPLRQRAPRSPDASR
jgi:hypothetical protein